MAYLTPGRVGILCALLVCLSHGSDSGGRGVTEGRAGLNRFIRVRARRISADESAIRAKAMGYRLSESRRGPQAVWQSYAETNESSDLSFDVRDGVPVKVVNDATIGTAIEKRFVTGTIIRAGVENDFEKTNSQIRPVDLRRSNRTRAYISLSQDVLRFIPDPVGKRTRLVAEGRYAQFRSDLRAEVDSWLFECIRDYVAMLSDIAEFRNREAELEYLESGQAAMRMLVDNGIHPAKDLLMLDLECRRKQAVLRDVAARLEGWQIVTGEDSLDMDRWAAGEQGALFEDSTSGFDEVLDHALESNCRLTSVRQACSTSVRVVESIRVENLPDLSVTGSVALRGTDSELAGALSKAVSWDYRDWGVGVRFVTPIGRADARELRILEAQTDLEKSRSECRQAEEDLRRDVAETLARLEANKKSCEEARAQLATLTDFVTRVQTLFEDGQLPSMDYLDWMDRKRVLESRLEDCRQSCLLEQYRLRHLTGRLLYDFAACLPQDLSAALGP